MNILIANLKLPYQKKLFFFWHSLFVITAAVAVFSIKVDTAFALTFLWLWVYLFAVIPTVLTVETFTMPFSFCLPGHRCIPRKVAFILALAIGFFWTIILVFTTSTHLSGLNYLALYSLLSATYLVSAWLIFCLGSQFVNVAIGLIAVLFMVDFLADDLTSIPLYLITHNPLWIIIGSTALAALLWRRMVDESIVRRYHQTDCTTTRFRGFFNDIQLKKTARKDAFLSRLSRSIERFLRGRISRSPVESVSKYIWGAFYTKPVICLRGWINWISILSFIVLIMVFVYMCKINDIGWLLVVWILIARDVKDRSFTNNFLSPHLFLGGRRERFYAALIFILTVCVFYSVMILLLSPITWLLALTLSQIPFLSGNDYLSFHVMSPIFAVIPWVLFPLSEGLYLLLSWKVEIVWRSKNIHLSRKYGENCCNLIVFGLITIGAFPFLKSVIFPGFSLIALVVVISWVFFARVLWTTTRDDCLI